MKKVQSFLTALEKLYLDCSRRMSQPLLLFLRKMGRDCLIDGVMIFIEPCALLFGHLGRVHCIQIPWDQGQDLELQELTVLILRSFYAEKLVLQTDAILSFQVNTRFVGSSAALAPSGSFQRNVLGPS